MGWWLFGRRKPSQAVLDAHQKLREVTRDDRVVDDLARRAQKLSRENNFALAVERALGLRQ